MESLKNRKYWAVASGKKGDDNYLAVGSNQELIKDDLKKDKPFLIELTVTKVFTRERDLIEIENDPNQN